MAPENILEKIQKLLNLKEGAEEIGSFEEAKNAASQVQKLLMKYNLDMADIQLHGIKDKISIDKFNFEDVSPAKNEGMWILGLYSVLSKQNFCRLVIHQSRTYKNDKPYIRKYAVIVGTKVNVGVVREMGQRMEERIRTFERVAWAKDRHNHKNRNAYRRAYFVGAVSGLNMQLELNKAKEMQQNIQINALVVQTEKDLENAMANLFENLTQGRRKRGVSNAAAYHQGQADGRQMPTGQGLN